jgi:uncharacterized protein YdaU (DUF1376 family)
VNYYPHHIGDFNAGTVRLSQLERWIYRDMIEVYYDTEQPLPADLNAVCKKIGARGDEQRAIVQELLDDKFTLKDDGYHHARCDAEIAEYHAKADVARENGKKGGRPKKANQNPEKPSGFLSGSYPDAMRNPDETGSQANQEPRTNNQEPVTKDKDTARSSSASASRFDARKWLADRGVDDQHITDWFAARAKKRLPNTLTAFQRTVSEAEKAGVSLNEAIEHCAARGFAGFNADMIQSRQGGNQSTFDLAQQVQRSAGPRQQAGGYVSKQEQLERNNRAVVERFAARIQAEEAAKGIDDETE